MFKKLMEKNKAREPKAVERAYGFLVEKALEKEGYTLGAIQAIINNFLAEPDNLKYKQEFDNLQAKRAEIKARYKA